MWQYLHHLLPYKIVARSFFGATSVNLSVLLLSCRYKLNDKPHYTITILWLYDVAHFNLSVCWGNGLHISTSSMIVVSSLLSFCISSTFDHLQAWDNWSGMWKLLITILFVISWLSVLPYSSLSYIVVHVRSDKRTFMLVPRQGKGSILESWLPLLIHDELLRRNMFLRVSCVY